MSRNEFAHSPAIFKPFLWGFLGLLLAGWTLIPACSSQPATTEEARAEAEAALVQFFDDLNTGEYLKAAALYGGDYTVLLDWNPEVNPNNKSELWRNGCEINGLQCLKVKQIIRTETVTDSIFDITVTFIGKDGSLFRLAACCGGNPTFVPPTIEFTYRVSRVGRQFLVTGLPPYQP